MTCSPSHCQSSKEILHLVINMPYILANSRLKPNHFSSNLHHECKIMLKPILSLVYPNISN